MTETVDDGYHLRSVDPAPATGMAGPSLVGQGFKVYRAIDIFTNLQAANENDLKQLMDIDDL